MNIGAVVIEDRTVVIETAIKMARLCKIAYSDSVEWRRQEFKGEGYDVQFFPVTETFLLTAADHQVLVFVGTDEFAEWINNVDVRKDRGVHHGFRAALDVVFYDIVRALDKDLPIFITGHSRGGALAALATSRLNGEVFNLAETYTFGSPRVLGYRAALTYPDQTYRVVNNNDIVCRAPTPLRFKHVGKLVYIDRNKKVHYGAAFLRDLVDRVLGRFRRVGDGVYDHKIDAYLNGLVVGLWQSENNKKAQTAAG